MSVAVYKGPPLPTHESVARRFLCYQELVAFTYDSYFTDKILRVTSSYNLSIGIKLLKKRRFTHKSKLNLIKRLGVKNFNRC